MKTMKIILPITAALLLAGQASAQTENEREAERASSAEAEFAERMREAEERLADAAQRVAELSSERLGSMGLGSAEDIQRYAFEFSNKPRIGVTIGEDGEDAPVEGVSVIGVTPGSAAADAGIRAGDIITSVNGESMSAESSEFANMRLLDFMKGVEEGDKLDIEYLRDGNVGRVELEPRVRDSSAFAWFSGTPGGAIPSVPDIQVAPEVIERFRFAFGRWRGVWGDMELVELSEGLGRYFGTDSGLLVISAPQSNEFKLQDGDVIQSIDGREPSSVNHCMRILGSYQPGEKLELNIMRDKRREKIEIEVPDDRSSHLFRHAPEPVKPAIAPMPVPPVAVGERT
ncbi:MAG: PDZ domain-containing protein [Gammaproteobacteria bacterium]|nr:PDZ domain-containing protein [Gammaproteobacteria bacterium]